MMLIDSFENSMKNIESKFRRLIVDSNWIRDGSVLTWRDYRPYMGKRSYIRQYEHLLSGRQYSFLVRDGSFFQFFYDFKGNRKIRLAKMAFYPAPMESERYNEVISGLNDVGLDVDWSDDFFLEYFTGLDGLVQVESLSHVRIDYDDKVASHAKAHLQYGALESLRITARHIVSPFVFLDFIVRNVHPGDYSKYSVKKGFSSCLLNEKKEHNLYLVSGRNDTFYMKI